MLVFANSLISSSKIYSHFPLLNKYEGTNGHHRLEPSLLNHTISTNLSGAFFATQAAARQMALAQSPPGGSIIGISSISALVGGGEQTHYTPTKAGVLSLMQSCAVALGKYGIRCNALLPGTIRTQLNDADLADPEKRTYMEGRIPLGRLGQPPDLAGPAVFLACEELSNYVVSQYLGVCVCFGWMILIKRFQ
jgi:L-rhamnose 1-dehydrogenase